VRFPIVVPLSFFFIILLMSYCSYAQGGSWEVYTSKRNVRDVAVTNGVVWGATSGGLFSYSFSDSSFQEFTTSNGLRTIDITAIAVDEKGTLWLGASDGWLQAYHPQKRKWEYFSDIVLLNHPSKRINALQVLGDTLFILSDVGVSLYSVLRREFGDTYIQFGSPSRRIVGKTTAIQYYRNKIWVSTMDGIASTDISNPNPSAPESWQVYKDTSDGLPSTTITPVKKILAFNDTQLFAATDNGLFSFNGTRWQIVSGTEGLNIQDLWMFISSVDCDNCSPFVLTFVAGNGVWHYFTDPHRPDDYLIMDPFSFPSTLVALFTNSVVATQSDGIFINNDSTWRQIIPLGPITNSFVGLTVDNNGVLWSGTGNATNKGFMRFDGRKWKNYYPGIEPRLGAYHGSAHQIDIGPGNTKWVSLWGAGVVLVGDDDSVKQVFSRSDGFGQTWNPSNDTNTVVVYGVVGDSKGDAWINIRDPLNDSVLAIYTARTNSFRFVKCDIIPTPIMSNIIEDRYGTKWFTTVDDQARASAPGLVFYDETRRLPKRLNDTTGWGVITRENGLTSSQVSAIAVDNDGSLWVGSPTPAFGGGNDGGISIIIDPLRAPDRILVYHPLQDQKINDILVDPLNRKWVATDRGIFLLSPDGTSILERYTVTSTNGILPDDKVVSLAMNRNAGVLYAGTEKGLAALSTPAVTPLRSFGELLLYPNPYYLPSNNPLTVDGLMQGSILKILTANGNLVKEIKTPGGRVGFWDGRDENGEWVASAVYLVIAFAEDGKQVATGKLAVLRR
jgi:ligand-binding sensor domain-containing protein